MHLCLFKLNVNRIERRLVAMQHIVVLLIVIAFFIGLAYLVHMCAKNNYTLRYSSKKRKIEIHPSQDKSHPTNG